MKNTIFTILVFFMILSCIDQNTNKNKASVQDKKKKYSREPEYNNENYVYDISFKYKSDDD